ncbi:hypothetical protein SRDD_04240 [Serratia sp. DD3]|nr:hypothetical protein SRDD_04240 [Serratia sp. DD3]
MPSNYIKNSLSVARIEAYEAFVGGSPGLMQTEKALNLYMWNALFCIDREYRAITHQAAGLDVCNLTGVGDQSVTSEINQAVTIDSQIVKARFTAKIR